jgi:hypothetical protein
MGIDNINTICYNILVIKSQAHSLKGVDMKDLTILLVNSIALDLLKDIEGSVRFLLSARYYDGKYNLSIRENRIQQISNIVYKHLLVNDDDVFYDDSDYGATQVISDTYKNIINNLVNTANIFKIASVIDEAIYIEGHGDYRYKSFILTTELLLKGLDKLY